MGIVTGFLCLICFLLLLAKAITRVCHRKRADRFFMRMHKLICAVLLIGVCLHIVFVFPVLKNRNIFVILFGIATVLFMLLLIYLCHRIKNKKRSIYWHRVITGVIALCMVGHIIVCYEDFLEYQRNIRSIVFHKIDFADVEDGTYEGEYGAGYIYAKVKVEIRDGVLVSVDLLEHRNERGKAAEGILDDMLKKQTTDVDAVSGATNSSKVIRKAIENAIDYHSADKE